MRKSKRLQVVARVAELREQQQLLALNKIKMTVDQQQQSMNQLETFQKEYLSSGAPLSNDAVSVRNLVNFSRFMQDVGQASQMQAQQLLRSNEQWQIENQRWLHLHSRRKRMEELIENAERDEEKERDIKSDRENDDLWATRNHDSAIKR